MSGPFACGQGLPSAVPLGGTETPAPEVVRARGERDPTPTAESPADLEMTAAAGATGDDAESEASPERGSSQSKPDPAPPSPASPATTAKSPDDCDDSGGSEPECRDLETGPCGAMFGGLCQALQQRVKPKVGSVIAACLRSKNRTSQCLEVQACIDLGLQAACVTPDDTRTCRETLERCGKPSNQSPWHTQERCERALAAMVSSERTRVRECLSNSCAIDRCVKGN